MENFIRLPRRPVSFMLTLAVAVPLVLGACAPHRRGSSVTLQWSESERPRYQRWESETRRDHQDYDRRNSDDQRAYWGWRQGH
jgi:hypothetical protein